MEKEILNTWGAVESLGTTLTGMLTLILGVWYKKQFIDKKEIKKTENAYYDKVKLEITEFIRDEMTKLFDKISDKQILSMEEISDNFSKTLKEMQSSKKDQKESIQRLHSKIDHVDEKTSSELKHLDEKTTVEFKLVRKEYVSESHCQSKMRNYK